ncbi:hypothetical protein [Leptolyngbya sp. FACHB-261]|uniref:hypothetical protein n=1 Tax=Leptolyngbya sp. FACHB-261 TaxID=2692806 RepID=UPI001F559A2A|nr:hypothetical protein [Leptolyngbya sp. FACHB-261]
MKRASGLKAISPALDFGGSLSLSNFSGTIADLREKIEIYNTTIAIIDSVKTEMAELEKTLGDMSEKMLIGVAFTYGKDSVQYEMAGGVRKSEHIRRRSKPRTKAETPEGQSTKPSAKA